MISEVAGLTLIFVGVFCSIVGAIGLVRFPDVYVRSHAATVAGIGGCILIIFGSAIYTSTFNLQFSVKALIIALIILLVLPTNTHAILRAAHKAKTPMWNKTFCDKLLEDKGRIGD